MTYKFEVWVRRSGGLNGLRPVLEAWVDRSMDYCNRHCFEDNAWWYNERASLSVLAAAAWSIDGWCALEEYPTDKRRQGEIPNSRTDAGEITPERHRGRCDLWIGNHTGYAVEAKQAWQSIGPLARGKNPRVWNQLTAARKAAGCLTSNEANERVAALFVAPYIPASAVQVIDRRKRVVLDKVHQLVSEWLTDLDLKSRAHVHAYAWVFPEKTQKFISSDARFLFPGTLLILSRRKRGNRRR
jgi:hypothetical protein